MLMRLRRIIFQLLLASIVLFAGYIGIVGAEAAMVDFFGKEFLSSPASLVSPRLWLAILLMAFGCTVSFLGAMFIIYLPVASKFPEECRAFSHKPSEKTAKLLRWFSRALERQAKEIERDV